MDYLIEIGTEELPAGTTSVIANNLKTLFEEKINDLGVTDFQSQLFATPRRIAIKLANLPKQSPERSEIIKGPGESAPAQAIEGFAKKHGLTVKELKSENKRYFVEKTVSSVPINQILSESINHATSSLTGERWMSWAEANHSFSRPVKWILSVADKNVLPLEVFGLKASNKTRVNRQIEAENQNFEKYIEVKSVADYEKLLSENLVIASRETRKEEIKKQILQLEKKEGFQAEIPEDLLEEVIDLLEYPKALIGSFEDKFLKLPDFLTTTVLIQHQRYFPCYDTNKKLLNKFVFIANCLPAAEKNVIKGNERVLRARLSDAEFFVQEDLKVALLERKDKLSKMTFQKELDKEISPGNSSMESKVNRLVAIAENMYKAVLLPIDVDIKQLKQACELAKCDLASQMVFEFPEVQGLAGGFILEKQNEDVEVAKAVAEHYLPNFSGDRVPSSSLGALVSLIDKIDNIASIFLIGKVPTGSADPYAIRRQTQGIIEILLKLELEISIESLFLAAYHTFDISNPDFNEFFETAINKKISLNEFILQRLIFILSQDHPQDIIEAFSTQQSLKYPLNSLLGNVGAFLASKDLLESLSSIRRISRILKDFKETGLLEVTLLKSDSERNLVGAYDKWLKKIEKTKDYGQKWESLKDLQQPIDEFFENVMVEDPNPDVAKNRKLILSNILQKANGLFLYPDWDKLVVYIEKQ